MVTWTFVITSFYMAIASQLLYMFLKLQSAPILWESSNSREQCLLPILTSS